MALRTYLWKGSVTEFEVGSLNLAGTDVGGWRLPLQSQGTAKRCPVGLSGRLLAARTSEAVALRHGLAEFLPLFRTHLPAAAVPMASGAWAVAS